MAQLPALREFNFNGSGIRCTGTDRDLWFVAKDVCEALEIAWRGGTLDQIPAEWRGMRKLRIPRRNSDGTMGFQFQDMVVIKEAAVYKLAFRSNKPSADAFTNWVASEVLPAIRKTGAYIAARRRRYEQLGKTEEWVENREEGIVKRKELTDTIQAHNANNYAECTNAIYRPVLGGSAAGVKMALQLKPKANLRDALATNDLMRVKFAEMMAADKIEGDNLRGNADCRSACHLAGDAVATAMRTVRETAIGRPGAG